MVFIRQKQNLLFVTLSAFFLTNALIAEFMGVKIFSLESTLGISAFSFSLFGEEIKGMSLTCGVLLWPAVFVLTDIINEYFGLKGVRTLSYIAAFMIGYAYLMLNLGMITEPASWWVHSSMFGNTLDFENAYDAVFGQGNKIILASLIAFILGQILDVWVFHKIKEKTGDKYIWLRSTGSTVVSQFIDSFVVLFLAFYVFNINTAGRWSFALVMAVCLVNYLYKFIAAILLTPVIYLVHLAIENYLGKELSQQLKQDAMGG